MKIKCFFSVKTYNNALKTPPSGGWGTEQLALYIILAALKLLVGPMLAKLDYRQKDQLNCQRTP